MSSGSGQASGSVLPDERNVFWLPGVEQADRGGTPASREANGPGAFLEHRRFSSKLSGVAIAGLCLAGQAAALPLLMAGNASAAPWTMGAAFGAAATIASWAGAKAGGGIAEKARSGGGAADLVLHDAFTLSLVLAASAVIGGAAAVLLLPAGAVLALVAGRTGKGRAAGERNAILLLAVLAAMAGLWAPLGSQDAATAAIALAAIAVMKAGHARLRKPPRRIWQVWGASALLCAAIVEAGHGVRGVTAAMGHPLALALAAGAIYGAATGVASQILKGARAKVLAAVVPFLSVAAIAASAGTATFPVIAAAVLLAAAIAGSRRITAAPHAPAISSPNGWPSGWF
jgi:hypothetical protein